MDDALPNDAGLVPIKRAHTSGLRHLLKGVVKSWIVLSDDLKVRAVSLHTETKKLIAEAKAELAEEKETR